MGPPDATGQMSEEGRALLTEAERAILSGEREVTDNYEYKVKSLVRVRIRKKFGRDADVLREHFPEAFEMLEAAVCGGGQ